MSGCADVCLSMEFDGRTDFYTEKVVTARKAHECCECRDVIPVGARYERVVGKWDGDFGTFETCLVCVEIRRTFCCGSWVLTQLWESVYDEMFPEWKRSGPWDCLAKLDTDEARAKMNAEYRTWADEDDAPEPLPTPSSGPETPK